MHWLADHHHHQQQRQQIDHTIMPALDAGEEGETLLTTANGRAAAAS